MGVDDEQRLRGRVCGSDHDGSCPGPLPHQTYAAPVGGLLDSLLLGIMGWRPERGESARAEDHRPGSLKRMSPHQLGTRLWRLTACAKK
ncbi:hypothetical protein ABZ527_31645 [Streptomyces griseofuscus]|uniref:hypothetical protein n=1 Tax=Streptomyces griseofuscus TaxID=146922 RepID=UPI0033DF4AD5